MSAAKAIMVVATRVADLDPDCMIAGSKPDGRCDLCGERVWRSPSTQKMMRRKKSSICRCSVCVIDLFDGTEEWMPLTKDQKAELRVGFARRRQ
jgi:hypothetical protein